MEYPLIYNKNHYTLMANEIVRGKQDMTLQEAKILRLVITQLVKDDNDFKTFTCRIIELAEFLEIDSSNMYRDIQDICRNLLKRTVEIKTNNPKQPWELFSWINYAQYDGLGNLTLKLSEQLQPYLLSLNEYFTQYKLSNILTMKSFYAIRIYEILKADEYKGLKYLEYSVKNLREILNCEIKYKDFRDFRINVIEKAQKEINKKTDIKITKIEYIKKGRSINSVQFYLAFPDYYKSRRSGAVKDFKKNKNKV